MIDSFNFKMSISGEGSIPSGLPKGLTKQQAIKYINSKNYEDDIKKRLIAEVRKYPSNALVRALNSLEQLVSQIRQEILNEKQVGQEGSKEDVSKQPEEGGEEDIVS